MAPLASIRQMSGHRSRGSVGAYQADERAGVARLCWPVSELRPGVGHCSNFTAILKGPVIGKTGLFQVYLENVALENI